MNSDWNVNKCSLVVWGVEYTLINALNTIFFSYSLLESSHGLTTSQLFVESADQSNTGNYSCSSDAGHSNTTAIHVITGKMIYPWFKAKGLSF